MFDWRIGFATVLWEDELKLWAVSQCFNQHPSNLKMTLLLLDPSESLEKMTLDWSVSEQEEMNQWLIDVLMNKPVEEQTSTDSTSILEEIDSIEEIPL